MAQFHPGERWPAVAVMLAIASGGCIGLVAARVLWTGSPDYMFLVWNLALAWAPFFLAIAVYGCYRRGVTAAAILAPLSALWLLFLPNAPYLVTDFIHLGNIDGMPRWFDALSLAAYAGTGLLLGFASLYLMQTVAAGAIGERTVWWLVPPVLSLSSVGIYLGRFQRLNSWDAIRQPRTILAMAETRLRDPLANETLLAVTVVFTLFLTASYIAAYYAISRGLTPYPRRH